MHLRRHMRKRIRDTLPALLALGAAAGMVVPAETVRGALAASDFSRYQVILDRRPFGAAVEPDAVGAAPVAVPTASFAPRIRMCAITARSGQIRVGFVDQGVKPEKSYYLFVGESEDGFEVVDADYAKEVFLLRKDGHEGWISMREGDGESMPAPRVAFSPPGGRPSYSGSRRVLIPASGVTPEQYRREVEAGTRPKPRSAVTAFNRYIDQDGAVLSTDAAEQSEASLRAYNLELIRARGSKGPALPIPLTPDEDAQLVKEGVLSEVGE